jgi:hypothetical protein
LKQPVFHSQNQITAQRNKIAHAILLTNGQFLQNTGLKEEAYFRYFSYPDFLTPWSGLIQIRNYAEIHNISGLLEQFGRIIRLTLNAREEL